MKLLTQLNIKFVVLIPTAIEGFLLAESYCITIMLLSVPVGWYMLPQFDSQMKLHMLIFIALYMKDDKYFSGQRSWVRFPALPDFLRSSRSGTGSTQPHEYN
jgi:hypothetical protein